MENDRTKLNNMSTVGCFRTSFLKNSDLQGFWYFAEKKEKFRGIFKGKFAEKLANFTGKKSKFGEKSADFAGYLREKVRRFQSDMHAFTNSTDHFWREGKNPVKSTLNHRRLANKCLAPVEKMLFPSAQCINRTICLFRWARETRGNWTNPEQMPALWNVIGEISMRRS